MKTVIKVSNLSKRYRLGLKEKQAETLAGQIANAIKSPWQNLKRLRQLSRFGEEDESVFWALKDVSFEVKEGEVLGIIGKNGAGKSTLLKILSQITEPTSGKIKIYGRVASLLEVGTGFHPELSGRENIYMNGTILGMTRREIDSKLDEIIDFSGVEKFIDTPVKFYSSGMKVRLGFSVAAHLDPEILIIDEVLAVGDYEFQKKCLGKMEDVSKNQGRTVLFVSHNMQAVSALTKKSLLLESGKIKKHGATTELIEYYLSGSKKSEFSYLDDIKKDVYIKSINLKTSIENNIHFYKDDFEIEFIVNSNFPFKDAAISYQIINSENVSVIHILNLSSEIPFLMESGSYRLVSKIPKLSLYPDKYRLKVHFADNFLKSKFQTIEDVCPFEVQLKDELREYYWYKGHATFVPQSEWCVNKIS
ncbi:polysaccharide ABC transporter ATP-binding protein [Algoriphagus vanfongensis]|uniref:ABC transporter ATP-binding protein n=1 Tax=Algoriphagus vanfongensis TaxID=426371 RepID=UPI0003F55C04|nr:ABC transporter ATP-binding protein [Algoriphagus vanfongensis]